MPEKWVQQRACSVEVLPLFFSLDLGEEKKAKRICQFCPVKEPCLEFALKHDEKGVWGGTSDRERNRIRIKRYQVHSNSVKLEVSLQQNNKCEPEHPIDASPSSLSYISFQESRNLLASQRLAALSFDHPFPPGLQAS